MIYKGPFCFILYQHFFGHLTLNFVILSKFQTIQFNISIFFVHTVKCQNSSISNQSV